MKLFIEKIQEKQKDKWQYEENIYNLYHNENIVFSYKSTYKSMRKENIPIKNAQYSN